MAIPHRLVPAALVAILLAVACDRTTRSTMPLSPTSTTPSSTQAARPGCATGDGVNDACACDADARTYCAGFYGDDWESYARAHGYTTSSWKYGLLDCLGRHPVSAACQASIDRREALNERMMAACATYCRGTSPQPGQEPCVDRLKSIYDSLDDACRAALDAHEAAKAVEGRGAL